jgi:hypothetical protein
MSFAGDETVNGIPVTLSTGERVIFFIQIGQREFHDQKMVEDAKVRRTATNTVIEFDVSRKEAMLRYLLVKIEKQEGLGFNYCFATCSQDFDDIEKVGPTWYSTENRPFLFLFKLHELTSSAKALQFRLFDEEPTRVLVDFKINVTPDMPEYLDKVPDGMIREFTKFLTGHGIYEATSTLRELGCNSEKDLQWLTDEDIEGFALPELTKRKLRMLAGYHYDGGPRKIPRKGDG